MVRNKSIKIEVDADNPFLKSADGGQFIFIFSIAHNDNNLLDFLKKIIFSILYSTLLYYLTVIKTFCMQFKLLCGGPLVISYG